MTDFLDQLETDLRNAADRRRRQTRRRRAVRRGAVGAAFAAAAIAVITGVELPADREISQEPPSATIPVDRYAAIRVVAPIDQAAATVLSQRLRRLDYPDVRDARTAATSQLGSVVLYRPPAEGTAQAIAQQLGMQATRPLTEPDMRSLGGDYSEIDVVVVLGEPDRIQLMLTHDCQPAGQLQADQLLLCTLESPHVFVLEQPDGERRLLAVDRPPSPEGVGNWSWAAASPDGRTILAQWRRECEVPEAYFIPADGGRPRSVTDGFKHPPNSIALGWSTDGRAIVFMPADPACGHDLDPGLYLITPSGQRTLLARTTRNAPPRSLKPSLQARTTAELFQAMR
jgi:hypothetical protein